jgi:hypothetical protein
VNSRRRRPSACASAQGLPRGVSRELHSVGAGVLGDIGLEKGYRHGAARPEGQSGQKATTAFAAVRDPSSPLYKLPGTASLPGLRSAGKGANKRPTVALHNLVVRPLHLVPEC